MWINPKTFFFKPIIFNIFYKVKNNYGKTEMHELTAVLEEPSAVENSQVHSPMSQYFVPVHTTCFYIRVKRKKKIA